MSRYTGVSQLQLRVSRYTVQLSIHPLGRFQAELRFPALPGLDTWPRLSLRDLLAHAHTHLRARTRSKKICRKENNKEIREKRKKIGRGSGGVQSTGVSHRVRVTERDESQSVPSPDKLIRTRDTPVPFYTRTSPSPRTAGKEGRGGQDGELLGEEVWSQIRERLPSWNPVEIREKLKGNN